MGKHSGVKAVKSTYVPKMLPSLRAHSQQDEIPGIHSDPMKERAILHKNVFKAKQKICTPEKEHS